MTMFRSVLLLFLLCATTLAAADWHVAPTGDDAAAGDGSAPLRSIQAAVDRAGPGDTVWIHPGEYRGSITIRRGGSSQAPLVVRGLPGAPRPVLKGSTALGGWWRWAGEVWAREWAIDSQDVFVDGAPLRQVGVPAVHYRGVTHEDQWIIAPPAGGAGDLQRGDFTWERASGRLFVRLRDGGDPNTRRIEAASERRVIAFAAGAGWTELRDLSVRHGNGSAHQRVAAAVELGDHCLMADCDIAWTDCSGVALGWQRTGSRLLRVRSHDNGLMGANVDGHAGYRVEACEFMRNNRRPYNPEWAAAGIKIAADSWGEVRDCLARHNRGAGIWFDWCNSGRPNRAIGNRVEGNHDHGAGLIAECSRDIELAENTVVWNDQRGIYVSACDRVRVHHNTLHGNLGWAALDVGGMPRGTRTLTAVQVWANILSGNAARYDVRVLRPNGRDIRDLSLDRNCYDRAGGPVLWWGDDARGGWAGTLARDLGTWRSASGADATAFIAAPGFSGEQPTPFRLVAGAPATGLGASSFAAPPPSL